MMENPYQSPASDHMEAPYQSPTSDLAVRRGTPPSVVVAVVAILVLFGLQGLFAALAVALERVSLLRALLQIGLGVLILVGTIAGHRLAWQWGRILAILGAVLLTLVALVFFAAIRDGEVAAWLGALMVVQVIPLYTVFFAFGRPSARVFFRLVCPKCGVMTNKAADFFFNRARCRRCGNVW